MPEIHVLPTQLVNKIAAGEVVERPASVVKELIENSLDAEARRIEVCVADGGRKLISVSDDGTGMSGEDLALAFAPHATSKLAAEADLETIATMGFRGEALASIASISHAHIRTRRQADESGYEITASAGNVSQVRPCAAAPGTTVTARDLFFNTPARRKFLRTANTEMAHVTEQVTRLGLPHPRVALTLSHNGREVLNLPPAESTSQRVTDIFGRDVTEALLPVSQRRAKIGVEGLIATPAAARGSAKWQYFFLNGRYVRDRVLAHALREAYRGLVEPGRYPIAFVFIRLDPAEVDVNVHPTKIEVRFRDSNLVHGELLAALKETLNQANLTPGVSLAAPGGSATAVERDQATAQQRDSLRQALADFFKSAPPPQPRFSFARAPAAEAAARDTGQVHAPVPGRADQHPQPAAARQEAPQSARSAPHVEAIQVHNSYIVAPCPDGLMIVDQHALHERLVYNDLKRRLAGRGESSSLTGQRMLIPETVKVTGAEMATLEANAALLAKLGLEVAPFGPTAVAVQQVPSLLAERGVAPGQLVREILDTLSEGERTEPEELLEDLLEMMACKAAVKAGDPLTPAEIDSLLARRETAESASACPHGRPTTLKLTLADLAKQFKRT